MKKKVIVLGITGCIAAYKAAEIARKFIRLGYTVKVVMTEAATHFVTPLTFQTLTREPVITSLFQGQVRGEIQHISLAEEADLILVAPATANILAKAARGFANDALSTTILSCQTPVVFAPAMNARMYLNPVTQENLVLLKKRGFYIIEPESGELACGMDAVGRLARVETIVKKVKSILKTKEQLKDKNIVVTAGGTREPIDPVRFMGNLSSGKMGYAIAEEAALRGAAVSLITAPTQLLPPAGADIIQVETAEEMRKEVLKNFEKADVVVKAAAVTDFRPSQVSKSKLKKDEKELVLKLVRNPDILEELGRLKKKQILVGFAAESENLEDNARKKLKAKNLDLVIANDITKPGMGFGEDINEVLIIDKKGEVEKYSPMFKVALARIILDKVSELLKS